MYKYAKPNSIIISLSGIEGFELRKKAADFVSALTVRGAEAGDSDEQSYGALAEIVIRSELGLPDLDPNNHPIGYDIEVPSGVKLDVKCRGGTEPFQELYASNDGIPREAKHNFFARQLHNPELNTDAYIMAHLMRPKKSRLPGTRRQRNWVLYVCGWVSKERVLGEGVYLPRGSLSERANSWFPYRGHEIEFYHQHLNGLSNIKDILLLDREDLEKDKQRIGNLHLTNVDAIRIATDLAGKKIIPSEIIDFLKEKFGIKNTIKSIFHQNQYFHLLNWLKSTGKVSDVELNKLKEIMQQQDYKPD